MTMISIRKTDAEIPELAGHMILVARGSSKTGREGKQIQIADWNLDSLCVPAEFHTILRDALHEQALRQLRAEASTSTWSEKYDAVSLATAYHNENAPIDWAHHLEQLEILIDTYQIQFSVPEKARKERARARCIQVKSLLKAVARGEAVCIDIKNAVVIILDKLVGWSGLPEWAPATIELFADVIGKVETVSEDII